MAIPTDDTGIPEDLGRDGLSARQPSTDGSVSKRSFARTRVRFALCLLLHEFLHHTTELRDVNLPGITDRYAMASGDSWPRHFSQNLSFQIA
jgi:hypothetical protein